jgi:hypothetical protein
LNRDLGEFVATIYSRGFKPQKSQARELAESLQSLQDVDGGLTSSVRDEIRHFLLALSHAMLHKPQHRLRPPEKFNNQPEPGISPGPLPISLALVEIKSLGNPPETIREEDYLRGEAAVAAALVSLLQRCSPEDDIFVATPHRRQRQAVKEALTTIRANTPEALAAEMQKLTLSADKKKHSSGKVTVDTVERLQGGISFSRCQFY